MCIYNNNNLYFITFYYEQYFYISVAHIGYRPPISINIGIGPEKNISVGPYSEKDVWVLTRNVSKKHKTSAIQITVEINGHLNSPVSTRTAHPQGQYTRPVTQTSLSDSFHLCPQLILLDVVHPFSLTLLIEPSHFTLLLQCAINEDWPIAWST